MALLLCFRTAAESINHDVNINIIIYTYKSQSQNGLRSEVSFENPPISRFLPFLPQRKPTAQETLKRLFSKKCPSVWIRFSEGFLSSGNVTNVLDWILW